jgi:ribosomal protein L9
MIQLTEPVKELGVVEILIQLKPGLASSCKIWVVAE